MSLVNEFLFKYDESTATFILEYQAVDEHGRAVGSKTHLEDTNFENLLRKSAECHALAAAAFERIKQKREKHNGFTEKKE